MPLQQGTTSLVLATAAALMARRPGMILPGRTRAAATTLGAFAWMQVGYILVFFLLKKFINSFTFLIY